MKRRSAYEVNAVTSGILGIMGISLLIVPSHLQAILENLSPWTPVILGALACFVSVSGQALFAIPMSGRREILIRAAEALLLLIMGGLFAKGGLFVEAVLLIFIGLAQAATVIPAWKNKHVEIDLFKLIIILISTASGIFLLSTAAHPASFYGPLASLRVFIAALFLLSAAPGLISFHIPNARASRSLTLLISAPWLAWCLIFLSDSLTPTVFLSGMIAFVILFGEFIPWQKLILPAGDVLGHMIIVIGSAIQLMVLVFLTALLTLIDHLVAAMPGLNVSVREAAFLFYLLIACVMYYGILTILMTINGLMAELTPAEETEADGDPDEKLIQWNQRIARYLKPFAPGRERLRARLAAQANQINAIARQLSIERKRNSQYRLLAELSQQLENQLDQPVSAQLTVNTLEKALSCSLASIYVYEPERHEFAILASTDARTSTIPLGYRQNVSRGMLERALRQRKTQIVNDARSESNTPDLIDEHSLSAVSVPLMYNGHVNGVIMVTSEKTNFFTSADVALIEAVGVELMRAWEHSGYHQRLMELIRAGSFLSSTAAPHAIAQEVSSIARQVLQARFTFVQIQLSEEGDFLQNAYSGHAPRLVASLEKRPEMDSLLHAAFHATQPFRIRDVRKYSSTSHLEIDHGGLRSMLAIPIRWHQRRIGVILAFGKQNEVFFTENNESLAELLSIQAAGALESAWMQQELRASLRTTSLLYRLSNQIIQAADLHSAAVDIAQTAHKLAKGSSTGIILFSREGKIEAEVEVDGSGVHSSTNHPMDMITQVMQTGQLIYLSHDQTMTRACLPIQTPIQKYGALWINIPEEGSHKPVNPTDLQTLVNQAAIALERLLLLVESLNQAREIKAAYDTLEATYDQTLAALMTALDARDHETEGHSLRVSQLTWKLGEAVGLSHQELKALERGSLLHDIGKIGISDTILHKPGPLSLEERKIMRLHPDIGARIIEGIPFLQDTMPVIRYHQERWDGSGYPIGLSGEDIPLLARIFTVVDVFDALTSNRPYRQKISAEEAIEYLRAQAGILFDPQIVCAFNQLVLDGQAADLLAAG